jgi:dipeptidyl aminopeptidase/acylaminoacyl peptidase
MLSSTKYILRILLICIPTALFADDTPPPQRQGYSGLGAETVSNNDLAKYAPQALDPSRSRRIAAMYDIRGTGVGLTTSNGDRQVYSSAVTGVLQVWRQDGPHRFPVALSGGEDVTYAVAIAPDDSFVIVARDERGQQNPSLYQLSLAGGSLQLVPHTPKAQTELQYISDDSKSIYIRSNDISVSSYAIYRHDLTKGTRVLVFNHPGIWSIVDHRGDESWLLAKDLGSAHREIYEYDLAKKHLTPLLGQDAPGEYEVAYGTRRGQLLVRTNTRGEFFELYSLESGVMTKISHDVKGDIDRFKIDDARIRIYYEVNDGGYARTFVLNATTLRLLSIPGLPRSENVSIVGVSHNGRFVELALDGSNSVPQAWTLDWQNGTITPWRSPSTPEIDITSFRGATLESYPARDGAEIPMLVWRPAKCKEPCPVVVYFHGGPEDQTRPGFNRYAQLFVNAGFVFAAPNVRGSSGYGRTYAHADDGKKRLGVIGDIEDAAKFIRLKWARGGVSPRIGVMGGSYGGYAALMAMTCFSGAYDAGVDEVGMSDLASFLTNTAPYRRELRISEYGDPTQDADALRLLSPVNCVDRAKGPLLIMHGVNDPRVPVGESIQIQKRLEARHIPSTLILFPDEGHGNAKRENWILSVGHTLTFFERHLFAK